MCVTAGGRACDPARLTRTSRQSTIEGHAALCDNKRALGDDPLIESLVNLGAVVGQNTLSYAHARVSQLHNTVAAVTRIHVNRADNHISDSSLEYRVYARTSASFCGARLESHVQRRASRRRCTEMADAFNLSVIAARCSMMSFCYDSVVNDQNRSDCWIRARLTQRLLCFV